MIKAYAPRINSKYCLAICGNQKALGNWDPDKAWPMSDANFPEWQAELDASKLEFPLEYKFVLYNKEEKRAELGRITPTAIWLLPKSKQTRHWSLPTDMPTLIFLPGKVQA